MIPREYWVPGAMPINTSVFGGVDDGAIVGGVDDGATVQRPRPTSSGGSGGGGTGSTGGGRGQMTFREFIQYQNQQAQAAARADAQTQRQGVYDWVQSTFDQWGMPAGFADQVINIVQDARSPEQAMTMIRDTAQYKERFAGNIARTKAGYGMLSEAEYLGLERSYRQSLRAQGLPEGFYDDPKDFAEWIAKDVSPEELGARAELAGNLAQQKDPQLWKELRARGITKGDAAAFLLDPDRALPAIQRKLSSAEIGRQAREAGLKFGTKFENSLVDKGITVDAAGQAFDKVAAEEDDLDALAARYGEKEFGKKGLVKAELGMKKKVAQRKKSLASRERAQFGGQQAGSASQAFGGSGF